MQICETESEYVLVKKQYLLLSQRWKSGTLRAFLGLTQQSTDVTNSKYNPQIRQKDKTYMFALIHFPETHLGSLLNRLTLYSIFILNSVWIVILQNCYCVMTSVLQPLSWIPPPSVLLPTITSLVFPDAWVRTVTPSCSCVPDDPVRSEPQPKPQSTIHSSVPLPGSVMDFSGEIQEHPSCVIKSVMLEETPEQGEQCFLNFRLKAYCFPQKGRLVLHYYTVVS